MKTLLSIFQPTLSRIPHLEFLPNPLKNIRKITDMSILNQRAGLVFLNKLITDEVTSLQESTCVKLIEHFDKKYDSVQYHYQNKKFVLEKYFDEFHVQAQIKSVYVQKFDHPFFRGTLYFHQIKDADKYMKIDSLRSFPKYLQDELKKMQVNQLLDQKNPLGVPFWSNPLQLQLTLSTKQSKLNFSLQSKLGKTIIKNCAHQPRDLGNKISIKGNKINSKIQQGIFEVIKNKVQINEEEFERMNSLKFVGGAVEKIQTMLNIYEKMGAAIQAYQQNNKIQQKQSN